MGSGSSRDDCGPDVPLIGVITAELEIDSDSDIRGCSDCMARRYRSGWAGGKAAFRIGARQNVWFTGMPALVFGFRTTYGAGSYREQRASDATSSRAAISAWSGSATVMLRVTAALRRQ
jgi:hypothetical protein